MTSKQISGTINDITTINVKGHAIYGTGCRKSLKISIKNNTRTKKPLTVIMLNPSEYAKDNNKEGIFIDQTITNLVKIANDNEYTDITVLNLFTTINPNSNRIDYSVTDNKNKNRIIKAINSKDDILIAWGKRFSNNTRHSLIKEIIQELKNRENVYTFCKKPNPKYPKHPGRINVECCRNCFGRNGCINLVPYF